MIPPLHDLDLRWLRSTSTKRRRALSVAERQGPSSKLVVAARRWCVVKLRENPNPNPDGRSFHVARPRLVPASDARRTILIRCALDEVAFNSEPPHDRPITCFRWVHDIYSRLDSPPRNPVRSNSKSDCTQTD